MSYPKVLVGVVTYEGKDYIFDRFMRGLEELDYPNFDVVIVDNSKGKDYYKKLKKVTKNKNNYKVYHVARGSTSREAQARSLNKIRDVMLEGDYDYFMSIESDLLPPRDIIERLISHNKRVVGTMYLIGYVNSVSQPPRPCIFGTRKDKDGVAETFNYKREEGFGLYGHGLIQVHGCGLGTTLIRRSIVEEFKFWYDLTPPTIKHSDVLFYMDLHNSAIPAYVDTDIIIPHHNSDWNKVEDK